MESRFVQAGPVRLQYFEEGDGPETIVLVHGYASSAALWRYTIEHLSREQQDGTPHFRIIAFNNRGAGDSGRADTEDGYTVQSFAEDLYNAVSGLGLSDFILVGLHVPYCELLSGWLSCSHLHKQHKGEQPLLACGHPAFARNSHSLFYRGLLRAKAGQSAGVETLTPSVHLPMLPHPRQRPPPSRGSFAQLPAH